MRIEEHDICIKGFEALSKALGEVEAERFIMLMNRGARDYTEWRKTHLYQDVSLEELAEQARVSGKRSREQLGIVL